MGNMVNKKWIIIGTVLLVGVGYTVKDYIAWRKEEIGKFGQGYSQMAAAAKPLVNIYENLKLGFRIRYPEAWAVTEIKDGVLLGDKVTVVKKNGKVGMETNVRDDNKLKYQKTIEAMYNSIEIL